MKVICVKWVDARFYDDMLYLGEALKRQPCIVYSVGFELSRDKAVILVGSCFPKEEVIEKEETFRTTWSIPLSCVLEIKEIGEVSFLKLEEVK